MGTRIALPVLSYDVPALQAWLEDRAAKGEFLSEYTVFPVFDRGEPRQVRYRLEPLARRKEREPDPRRREDYESLGWRFVCAVRGGFHLWRCDDPAAPELFTEPESEGAAYRRLIRSIWRGELLLAGAMALLLGLLCWQLCSDTAFLRAADSWMPTWELVSQTAMIGIAAALALYMEGVLRRYVRALRTGVPQPHRRPYRLAQGMTGVLLAMWAGWIVLTGAQLVRPASYAYVPVADLDQPVPYVTLAELGETEGAAAALHVPNWITRNTWLAAEGHVPQTPSALSRYYELYFPAQAGKLERAWVADAQGLGWTLEPLTHPALDGAWLYRAQDGAQVLLVRQDRQVLEFQYHGEGDLAERLDVFAAALSRFAKEGSS